MWDGGAEAPCWTTAVCRLFLHQTSVVGDPSRSVALWSPSRQLCSSSSPKASGTDEAISIASTVSLLQGFLSQEMFTIFKESAQTPFSSQQWLRKVLSLGMWTHRNEDISQFSQHCHQIPGIHDLKGGVFHFSFGFKGFSPSQQEGMVSSSHHGRGTQNHRDVSFHLDFPLSFYYMCLSLLGMVLPIFRLNFPSWCLRN